jgi:hypothetical protein
MTFDWYKIVNRAEFLATGLVSRELELVLEGVGTKTVMIVVGNLFSLVYEGVLLSIGVTEENPFAFDGYAVYVDANDDVWLGIEVEA